jgi:hypothetical protein
MTLRAASPVNIGSSRYVRLGKMPSNRLKNPLTKKGGRTNPYLPSDSTDSLQRGREFVGPFVVTNL